MDIKVLLEKREKSLRLEIQAADVRLAEVAEALERDGLVVSGSRGQPRANNLLGVERQLRRERGRALDQLENVLRRLHAARQAEAANKIWTRSASDAA